MDESTTSFIPEVENARLRERNARLEDEIWALRTSVISPVEARAWALLEVLLQLVKTHSVNWAGEITLTSGDCQEIILNMEDPKARLSETGGIRRATLEAMQCVTKLHDRVQIKSNSNKWKSTKIFLKRK
jgi:hypothetical protein